MSYAEALKMMLVELESGWLEVVKIPTTRYSSTGTEERGYKRVAISRNAEWYSKFCGEHVRGRSRYSKARTIIKRQCTIKALHRMMKGDRETVYAQRLLDFIQRFFNGDVKT